MNQEPNEVYLLHDVLKPVARSFYLTIAALPARVRKPVGLAYLFARIADTVADTGQVDRSARVMVLQQFKRQFVKAHINWDEINGIQSILSSQHRPPGDQTLLKHVKACFHMYEGLAPEDQQNIRQVLPMLIRGMEMDVQMFPGESEAHLAVLPTLADLDRYTYQVAGCVGEFWTNVLYAHIPRIRRCWDREQKIQMGIQFGKGLQLTNILKDLAKDLRRGRCYIPLEMLQSVGLDQHDLLNPHTISQLRPVVQKLAGITLAHLDQGWLYTMSIPRFDIRLRLACMWPILIALRTLHMVTTCDNLLDPTSTLKISRFEVWRIVLSTTITLGGDYTSTAYWGHCRKAVG